MVRVEDLIYQPRQLTGLERRFSIASSLLRLSSARKQKALELSDCFCVHFQCINLYVGLQERGLCTLA